jgi:hypothetical protein
MRLGTLLLRDAVISLTQLEQGLRAQVLCGGRLGTNLVELGFIDINTLGRYLARVLDTPLAIADRFEKADSTLIEEFGAERADHYNAIPLGYEKNEDGTIAVAMANPSDREAVRELEAELGASIRPYVAAELRILYYLERYYGLRRRTRFTREPSAASEAPRSRRERRSTRPLRGPANMPGVRIAPRSQRADTESEPSVRPATICTYKEALARIDEASHRDDIAHALMAYGQGRVEGAALFMVRKGQAMGWVAHARGLGDDALARLSVALDGASVLQTAYDSGKPYHGPAPTAGRPVERELWSYFALEHEPGDLHVVPIQLADRVINLWYAHGFEEAPATTEEIDEMHRLGERAGEAYLRLIAAQKAN